MGDVKLIKIFCRRGARAGWVCRALTEQQQSVFLSHLGYPTEGLLLVGSGCRSHRNRRHIAYGQVAHLNVGYGASISDRRMSATSLNPTLLLLD
jgi:hypothetical protein